MPSVTLRRRLTLALNLLLPRGRCRHMLHVPFLDFQRKQSKNLERHKEKLAEYSSGVWVSTESAQCIEV
jgi:hypothetical protein